jgi:hypothetical protein
LSAAGAAEIQFKDSGTTFYADYKNARRIVDTGGPHPLHSRQRRDAWRRLAAIRLWGSAGLQKHCLTMMVQERFLASEKVPTRTTWSVCTPIR